MQAQPYLQAILFVLAECCHVNSADRRKFAQAAWNCAARLGILPASSAAHVARIAWKALQHRHNSRAAWLSEVTVNRDMRK
jgi:hypothetical protein